jgi:aryl-alcohol dehydrogenase-like predicted oxidoreductase
MNQPDHDELGPLRVSRLCLGTMLMGGKTPPAEAHRMLDAFVDAGHNFLDTADVYGDGAAEEVLRPWLASRREEVVVTSKVRFPVADPGGAGLAPERIHAACDASLRRMGVDEIDLYMLHAPDPEVDLEDTLEALEALVRAGKVRALGISNFPAWMIAWAVRTQDCQGWSPFVALQAQYSLVERSAELDMLPFTRAAGLGVMPWGPLGGGFLTGRMERHAGPEAGSRLADAPDAAEEALHRRATEANWRTAEEARAVAGELGATVPQVAIAWLLHQPGITAPVIGPRTASHLDDLLPAAALRLSDEQLARVSAHAAPPTLYPHRLLAAEQLASERPLQRPATRDDSPDEMRPPEKTKVDAKG